MYDNGTEINNINGNSSNKYCVRVKESRGEKIMVTAFNGKAM